MGDLRNPRLLYLKGGLFVMVGLIAAALLVIENPSLKMTALLCLCVWAFARAYYFAFYVVQHSIDPEYRFAGLGSFFVYLVRQRQAGGDRREGGRSS